jgi:hypothetical protein
MSTFTETVKVKVKLTLCFKWAPRHEGVSGEWRYSSTQSLSSALDGGEWSTSRPGRFTLRGRTPGTHWIGGWVSPRAVLDTVVERNILSPRRESNPRTVTENKQRIVGREKWSPIRIYIYMDVWIAQRYSAGLRAGWSGVRDPAGAVNFSLHNRVQTGSGPTQSPIQWAAMTLSSMMKRPGREANHSPPSSVIVKNTWSYTSTLPYVFMLWRFVKHTDNFTLPKGTGGGGFPGSKTAELTTCLHLVAKQLRMNFNLNFDLFHK